MTRKILALAVVFVMALGVVSHAAFFTDLQDGSYDWAKETINNLADRGIIKGYSDGTYGPAREITRQEAFTLFARAAGVNDSENAYGVEFNQYVYKDVTDKYNTYANKELCFMLERGILTQDEIGTYLSDNNKDKVMLRHEAAVLISKILGIRDGFDEDGEYLLDFTDVNDIPDESMAAVGFASREGILTGMEDGSFSPNTGVTRAQIAIMLDRIINKLEISYTSGTVSGVYEDAENTLEIDGTAYTFDEATVYSINGKAAKCADIQVGDSVTVVNVNSGVWAVEVMRLSELEFKTVRGKVKDVTSTAITMVNGDKYGVSAFLTCFENGKNVKLEDMNLTNPVTMNIVNGFVRGIEGTGDICIYEAAKIKAIATLPVRMLKIESDDGIEEEYEIDADAAITRNGYETDLKSLSTKELCYVRIEEGLIKEIGAYTNFEDNAAVIRQIVIDEKESSVLLKLGNGERFKIENDTEFVGEGGVVLTIYDLRIGDTVTAEFKSGKVAVLKYGKYVPPTSFGGEIAYVNTEDNIIEVTVDEEVRIVKINSATSIVKYSEAENITLSDLKKGDYVVVAGEFIGDDFVAKSIIL